MTELEIRHVDWCFHQFFLQFDAKTKIYGNSSSSFEFKY